MKRLANVVLVASVLALGSAQAAESWRTGIQGAAQDLAGKIEELDEVLHEVYDQQGTEPFKKAVDFIHHIESIVLDLGTDALTAPYGDMCHEFEHLYEDLVEIREYLISLRLENNPQVVAKWNNMVWVYNNRLLPYFRACRRSGHSGIRMLQP